MYAIAEAPRRGAGIEIVLELYKSKTELEAPRRGAGIEINHDPYKCYKMWEAPRRGAGIEILKMITGGAWEIGSPSQRGWY